jgi:hypothetical protein
MSVKLPGVAERLLDARIELTAAAIETPAMLRRLLAYTVANPLFTHEHALILACAMQDAALEYEIDGEPGAARQMDRLRTALLKLKPCNS